MKLGSQQQSPPKPRTLIGQWLRAGVLEETEVQRKLSRQLNGGVDGWNDDEPAVVEAACELAVRQFFGSRHDVRDIADFVSEVRDRVRATRMPINKLETEAVIRSALGERDVDISDLRHVSLLNMRSIIFGRICIQLGLDERSADQLIVKAENVAFERGWNPPLANVRGVHFHSENQGADWLGGSLQDFPRGVITGISVLGTPVLKIHGKDGHETGDGIAPTANYVRVVRALRENGYVVDW